MDEMYRQFAAVLVVLATLIAVLWLAKKHGLARLRSLHRVSGDPIVTVLQRVHLAPQHTLYVLGVGERRLLVTSSPGSCQLISEVSAESNSAQFSVTAGKRFP
jgi:flagellar biogenesis protein FliO